MKNESKKGKKLLIAVIIAALLVVIAILIFSRILSRGLENAANDLIAEAKVTSGDISATVVGSGTLANADIAVELPYGVTIQKILAEVGDAAQKGDVLAKVSDSSVASRVSDIKSALANIESEMKTLAENSEKTVSVKSETKARVKKIYAVNGSAVEDIVAESEALMLLSLDGKMAVTFDSETSLALGDSVSVIRDGGEAEGSVVSASAGTYVVTLSDDGPKVGERVDINSNGKTIGNGELYIHEPLRVTADFGRVASVNAEENKSISAGDTLLTIIKPAANRAYESLIDKQNSLLNTLEQLTKLSITGEIHAPVSGTITEILAMPGAALAKEQDTSTDYDDMGSAFKITAKDVLSLNVNIDESDISAVNAGQEATVEIDAIPGKVFEGTVKEVSNETNASENASNYSAIIEIEKTPEMKLGMSATAVIIKEERSNVPIIPLAAVQEFGSDVFVYVSRDENNMPSGRTPIETGLSDGTMTEVVSGLKVGDTVYFAQSPSNNSRDQMMFGVGNPPGQFNGGRVSEGGNRPEFTEQREDPTDADD
ncbi:MAG: HlyD family efflux transporter periplasmic adaptor subunit [Clostridiales Family XIII bacterium]|jgi:HlyD family secretion protein|nr:HlyD family efflux transporter periplasmic adaptor subunit [Clostridiales Family XIII bacterium]